MSFPIVFEPAQSTSANATDNMGMAGAVFVDVRITADIADSLVERGFAKQRCLTRLSLGESIYNRGSGTWLAFLLYDRLNRPKRIRALNIRAEESTLHIND